MQIRPYAVIVHRYVGLVMAGFLLIAGLTGALLAWYHELDVAINPQLFLAAPPSPGAQPLDPLLLRERVLGHYPGASVIWVPLRHEAGETAMIPVRGAGLAVDEVYVNPYTGEVQGARKWGALSDGITNLMPFIYRLHFSLALDPVGTYLFGIVALLWTLDCFIGAYLTFPSRQSSKGWWRRWWPAWKVRRANGNYKFNFDLHRAGGLWAWAMLFVIAWSGVAFNLTEVVYRPVMSALFDVQPSLYHTMPQLAKPAREPGLGWAQGVALGRVHMAAMARDKGFAVQEEQAISYAPGQGFFRYTVKSDRDIRDKGGSTSVFFDARTGTVLGSQIPTGETAGDTITMWLLTLHLAHIWGMPFRIFITLIGLLVAMLSITGVYLWWRKRKARLATAHRASGANLPAIDASR